MNLRAEAMTCTTPSGQAISTEPTLIEQVDPAQMLLPTSEKNSTVVKKRAPGQQLLLWVRFLGLVGALVTTLAVTFRFQAYDYLLQGDRLAFSSVSRYSG
jgi:hypothetical protein